MESVSCGVCGYTFPLDKGEPANFRDGALYCTQCDTVSIFEKDHWTPIQDSELAAKVRAYIKQRQAYHVERARRLRRHYVN